MSELKLIVGDETASPETPVPPAVPEAPKVNPMDALNRRDIELIKRSLASMHKDCAELRSTIVALHGRQSRTPSRGFFVACGAVALVAVIGLSAARPLVVKMVPGAPTLASANTAGSQQ